MGDFRSGDYDVVVVPPGSGCQMTGGLGHYHTMNDLIIMRGAAKVVLLRATIRHDIEDLGGAGQSATRVGRMQRPIQ